MDNIITKNESIWTPGIVFLNTMTKRDDILIFDDITTVIKMENGTINDQDQVEMLVTYVGEKNFMNKMTNYIIEFSCFFDNIVNHPFGAEICYMDLAVNEESYEFVNLIAKGVKYTGPGTIGQYAIIREKFKIRNVEFQNGRKGLRVEVVLERKISSIILVTYLPTILMNIINQAPIT